MTQQLFYRGDYLGEVSTISSTSHLWVCQCCSETFAYRHQLPPHDPFRGPLRYTIWESLCAKCASEWAPQYPFLLPDFHRGGDASNQPATIKAQFLYETDLYLRSQSASQANALP